MTDFILVRVAALGSVAVLAFLIIASVEEERQWEAFKAKRQCTVIGVVDPSSTLAVGVSANGSVAVTPVFIPGKTGWKCDDGVTYWK